MIYEFKIGERVVYPSHGVGEIIAVESQAIAGTEIKVYVVSFPHEKMTVKVPISRASLTGLRALIGKEELDKIYLTLQSKARTGSKVMWSRRAQEYGTKINSGDILSVAEVVRDLYKNCDRSYSERTIYELALSRLAREVAILEGIIVEEAINKIIDVIKEKVAA